MAKIDPAAAEEVVRRFVEQVLNERRLDQLAELVAPDVRFDHIRPGQEGGLGGLHESLAVLFNVVPHLYVRLGTVQVNNSTVVTESDISGSLLIWPVHQDYVEVTRAVHVFGVRVDKKIVSIQTLDGFRQVEEEDDDDDDGPGPAPPGPRWIPPRPDLTKPRR